MNPALRRPTADEEAAAPVTILDGSGRLITIVPADEFRRTHGAPKLSKTETWRRKQARLKASEPETGTLQTVA